MYCLQAPPCSFQPGNFTGWVSEGVKGTLRVKRRSLLLSWALIWLNLFDAELCSKEITPNGAVPTRMTPAF